MNAFFEDYQRMKNSNQSASKLPHPSENFDSYLQSYNEVDDILTQTLNSLQDLDIPVGQPNLHHHQPSSFTKGHMKKPSGTAIFGFAQHDKNLSIPGLSVAPSQLYSPNKQSEPVLFGNIQDLEKKVKNKDNNDFIITNEEPKKYKFPSSSSITSSDSKVEKQKTVEVSVEYLQKLKSMIKNSQGLDMESFLDNELSTEAKKDHIKKSNTPPLGLGLKYDSYESRQQPQQLRSPPSHEVNPHQQLCPVPYYSQPPPPPPIFAIQQQQLQQQAYCQVRYQDPMTHLQPVPHLPQQINHIPPPPPQPQQSLPYMQPPASLIMQQDYSKVILQPLDTSESEFSDCPKTPSPTLKSQAQFDTPSKTSPRKNISWTPVSNCKNIAMSEGRKPHDKVSTLPPGEIDLYITGPTKEKTYICNYENCGKVFTRRYNARSHVQTHLSDRPFVCDHENCNKSFVRQHDLTRHKKVHTEFANKCSCGKKFARLDALFRHRQRQICSGGFTNEELATQTILPPSGSVNGSINKPKKHSSLIKIDNDNVAKRLEFDIVNHKQQLKTRETIDNSLEFKPGLKSEFIEKDENNVFYDLNFNENYLEEF